MSLEFALMRNGLRAVYASLNRERDAWCLCRLSLIHSWECPCACHEQPDDAA